LEKRKITDMVYTGVDQQQITGMADTKSGDAKGNVPRLRPENKSYVAEGHVSMGGKRK
jgi:hypothetical protein